MKNLSKSQKIALAVSGIMTWTKVVKTLADRHYNNGDPVEHRLVSASMFLNERITQLLELGIPLDEGLVVEARCELDYLRKISGI